MRGVNQTGLTVNREGYEMYSIYGLEAIGYIQPEDYDADGNYLGATQYGNFGPGDINIKVRTVTVLSIPLIIKSLVGQFHVTHLVCHFMGITKDLT